VHGATCILYCACTCPSCAPRPRCFLRWMIAVWFCQKKIYSSWRTSERGGLKEGAGGLARADTPEFFHWYVLDFLGNIGPRSPPPSTPKRESSRKKDIVFTLAFRVLHPNFDRQTNTRTPLPSNSLTLLLPLSQPVRHTRGQPGEISYVWIWCVWITVLSDPPTIWCARRVGGGLVIFGQVQIRQAPVERARLNTPHLGRNFPIAGRRNFTLSAGQTTCTDSWYKDCKLTGNSVNVYMFVDEIRQLFRSRLRHPRT